MRIVLFLIFITFSSFSSFAQDLEFKASAIPKVLRVGEQFQLVYEVNQNVSRVEIPDLSDFQLLGGPMTSSSTSIQIINNKTTKTVKYTYTYYLRAIKDGNFTIPPASVKYKGKTHQSNSIAIEVIPGGSTSKQSQSSQNQQSTSGQNQADVGEDVFVRLHLDKRSAYIGEQIIAWIKIYTKVNLSGIDQGFKGPEFTGFYKQPVEIPPLRSLERENVNGEIYYTGTIQKMVLYPQKTGEITIKPFDLEVSIQKQVQSRSRSIFDDFFGPSVQNIPLTLKSNKVKITVNPLPPKPESFTGAVGNFNMKTTVDKTALTTNEALTYKVSISGKGNIKLIDEPVIKFPPNIEQFEPKTTLKQTNELSGTKIFEYVLIPRYAGEYKISPIDFTYFNPSTKKFITLTSDEFSINVEKGDEDTTTVVISGLSKEDFKLLGKDILFIKNKPFKLYRSVELLLKNPAFYVVYLISFILFILVIIFRRETIKRNANVSLVKNRKANKYAKKRLRKAYTFLKQNKQERFYEEIMKAIWGYMGDKLTIPVAELSRDKLNEELTKLKIDKELINSIYNILDNCEYARFAPGGKESGMEELYKNVVELISKLQQKLK